MILGIDPGQSGGLAFVEPCRSGDRLVHELVPMAGLPDLIDLIYEHKPQHVFLEKAQAMPKQGVVSMFTYGQHFGELVGMLVTLKLPFTLVQPTAWTKIIHEGTDSKLTTKERTLQACMRLYPTAELLATPKSKKPHLGMVDALMIAEYGIRKIFK